MSVRISCIFLSFFPHLSRWRRIASLNKRLLHPSSSHDVNSGFPNDQSGGNGRPLASRSWTERRRQRRRNQRADVCDFDLSKGCHYGFVFRGRVLSSGLIGAWMTHFVLGIYGRLHTLTEADPNKYRVWVFFSRDVILPDPFVVLEFPVDQYWFSSLFLSLVFFFSYQFYVIF